MAKKPNEEPDDEDEEDDDEPDKPGGKPDLTSEVEKWKRLSRQNETKARANADAAKKLEEIESANKTELEKAQSAAKTAEEKATGLERDLMRLRVAIRKSLNETQAKRLVGDSEEELEADADELLSTFRSSAKKGEDEDDDEEEDDSRSRNGNSRPREALKSGSSPKSKPSETDPMKLVENIPRAGGI